jgi:hypothetical protein
MTGVGSVGGSGFGLVEGMDDVAYPRTIVDFFFGAIRLLYTNGNFNRYLVVFV